jgi:hypothetical protein
VTTCPSACGGGACANQPGCYGAACWCKSSSSGLFCHNEPFGCGGGGPRDPFVPVNSLTTPIMSVKWVTGNFKNGGEESFLGMLAWRTGWTITADSSVAEFELTGEWSDLSWFAILSDVVNDQELCMTVNTTTKVISITSCS